MYSPLPSISLSLTLTISPLLYTPDGIGNLDHIPDLLDIVHPDNTSSSCNRRRAGCCSTPGALRGIRLMCQLSNERLPRGAHQARISNQGAGL